MHTRYTTVAAMIAGMSLATSAQAGFSTEEATATFQVLDPGFDTTMDADLFINQFDTMGGSRQLVSVDLSWLLTIDFSGAYADNNTSDTIGSQVEWETVWTGNVAGVPLPYTPDLLDLNRLYYGIGYGEDSDPGAPGGVLGPEQSVLGVLDDSITDAALLSALTGSGQAHIDGMLDISAAVEVPYGGALHDIFFPHVVFVPGYMTATMDSYTLELTATYHYVPAPASALTLGVFCLVRRKRRPCIA